jgi:hydroxyethylthiazole kinase
MEAEPAALDAAALAAAFARLRERRPLVHHITNVVTAAYVADVTTCLGASPIMASDKAEVAEVVARSGALVLNVGTPTPSRFLSMQIAGREANSRGVPVVLDPVGVGVSTFRREGVAGLLDSVAMAVVRGNAAEVAQLQLDDDQEPSLGTEAPAGRVLSSTQAGNVSRTLGAVVAVTGQSDLVVEGGRALRLTGGHSRMAEVVGTGCMASAAIACFAAVERDHFLAAVAGLLAICLAGERAVATGAGHGSLRPAMLDALARLSPDDIEDNARISPC